MFTPTAHARSAGYASAPAPAACGVRSGGAGACPARLAEALASGERFAAVHRGGARLTAKAVQAVQDVQDVQDVQADSDRLGVNCHYI